MDSHNKFASYLPVPGRVIAFQRETTEERVAPERNKNNHVHVFVLRFHETHTIYKLEIPWAPSLEELEPSVSTITLSWC